MNNMSFSEFAKKCLEDGIDLLPWQKQIFESLQRGTFAFRSFPFVKGDLQFELRWGGQLSLMRAYWIAGRETTMISPHITQLLKKPSILIIDDWRP